MPSYWRQLRFESVSTRKANTPGRCRSFLAQPRASHSIIYLSVGCLLALLPFDLTLGQEVSPFQYREVRKLYGDDYRNALELKQKADSLRAELDAEKRSAQRSQPRTSPREWKMAAEARRNGRSSNEQTDAPLSPQLQAKADAMIAAFNEVLEKYPGTEVAADCAMRLSGALISLGKREAAEELLINSAVEFAGTREGTRFCVNLGGYYLQSLKDPAKAKKWLELVPKPVDESDTRHGMDRTFYLSAQQKLIRCEIDLFQDAEARRRLEALKVDFPKSEESLDKSFQVKVGMRAARSTPITVNYRARYILWGNLLILAGLGLYWLLRHFTKSAVPGDSQDKVGQPPQ